METQLRDVRAFMTARAATATTATERAEWSGTERTNLVNMGDMYALEIWPDDPAVHAEHEDVMALLADYHAMLNGE
ncbi:hypothetical protein [Nocardiopsis dassonvillei]|uniref:hypothetical protein n=1 Tax=Nocardiopsis dassonvillei TaxID=2014 RepID=UPI00362A01A7